MIVSLLVIASGAGAMDGWVDAGMLQDNLLNLALV
jgi:hypothetical protein